jgi:hypothetical protein
MQHASFMTRAAGQYGWVLLGVLGCAASQTTRTEQPSQNAAAPGQVHMHDPPAAQASSATPARSLGALEPVHAVAVADEPPVKQSIEPTQAPAPIRVATQTAPRPYALREGDLVLPVGLIVHSVPKGVSVRIVQEQGGGDVWEILDAHGRRAALLKAESLASGALPQGALLSQTANARSVGQRTDWGAAHVKVVTERFLNENHVFTIERRAEGTAWIWSGLELSGRAAASGSAH